MGNRRAKFKDNRGKIGYCNNSDLPFGGSGGHYVYIRKHNKKTGNCVVSTCTSLENSNGYRNGKITAIKSGNLYPIPLGDSNFAKWTGVNKNTHQVHIGKIQNIGSKTIKKRHHFMIGKNK